MNFRRTPALLAAALAIAIVGVPAAAQAETIKVTTKKDEDGICTKKACSLREAAGKANNSGPKSKIKLGRGTYKVKLGQIDITTAVKLQGAGARKTKIKGNGSSRVMQVSGGPSSISKVTITGGNATLNDAGPVSGDGGGLLITSEERFVLSKAAVVGNTAQMSGGGVIAPFEAASATPVTVKQSLIARNTVTGGAFDGSGGGILVAGDLKMENSTVAKNVVENTSATNRGGGVSAMISPLPGDPASLKLTNVTIAGNEISGAGADGMGGGLALSDPLMGAGVEFSATNTIVAQNTVAGSPEDCGMIATVASSKNNLSSDATCMFDDAKSLVDTNPKLGKLKRNGGQTETMKPKRSSPAINAGTKKCKSPDQRGKKRPKGKACDLGAVEAR